MLQARHIKGSGLCLMFSEEVSGQLTGQIIEFSRQVRQLGCEIGITDFGASQPSFSHLHGIAPQLC